MTSNKKVLKVLQGFIELNSEEKQIFRSEIMDFLNQNYLRQSDTEREIRAKLQANLGPTNDNNCPCCGKS